MHFLKNIETCKFAENAVVYQDDVFKRVKWLQTNKQSFDIIYMDPPFTVDEIFHPVLEAVADAKILKEDGILAIRTVKEKEMPEVVGNLTKYKLKIYGISAIHFYRIEQNRKNRNRENHSAKTKDTATEQNCENYPEF